MAASPLLGASGLAESEALSRSSPPSTHPAMFGFTGGEWDEGNDMGDDDDDDAVIVPSTFTVEVLIADDGSDDATILDAR